MRLCVLGLQGGSMTHPPPVVLFQEQGSQDKQPGLLQNCESYGGSDVTSGKEMSDSCDGAFGGGKLEGRASRKHHRRSTRMRSRQERASRPRLTILNVCNTGDKMVECQLETHNHKMVTFKFDLDGDAPDEIATYMVEHDFILPSERETFIEQMKDVMDKAEDMLSEDTDADHGSDPGASPPHMGACGLGAGEEGRQSQENAPVYQQNVLHTGKRWFIICPVAEHPAVDAPESSPPLPLGSQQPEASQDSDSKVTVSAYVPVPSSTGTCRADIIAITTTRVPTARPGTEKDSLSHDIPKREKDIRRSLFLFPLDPAPGKDQLSLEEKPGTPAAPQRLSQAVSRDTTGSTPAPLVPSSPPVVTLPQDASASAAGPKPEPTAGTALEAGGSGTPQGLASERETLRLLAETHDTQLVTGSLGEGQDPCLPPTEALRHPAHPGLGEPVSAGKGSIQGEPTPAPAPVPSAAVGAPQPALGQPLAPVPTAVGAVSVATPQLPSPPLGPTAPPQPPSALESDGEGPPPRVGFVDNTIKSLDEKLRTLLYQEHVPTSSASAGTPMEASDKDFTLEPLRGDRPRTEAARGDPALLPQLEVSALLRPVVLSPGGSSQGRGHGEPYPTPPNLETGGQPQAGAEGFSFSCSSGGREGSHCFHFISLGGKVRNSPWGGIHIGAGHILISSDRWNLLILLIPKDAAASVTPAQLERTGQSSGPRETLANPMQSCPGMLTEDGQDGHPQMHSALASGSPRKRPGQQDSSSPAKTMGRFSVVSTQDEWTLASPHSLRYSAPPDVYLDQAPRSPDVKLAVRRAQTASSIEVGVGEPASSDSGDECPRRRLPPQKNASLPSGGGMASDLVKKATAFLHRSLPADSPGLETPSRTGVKVPTISVTSFHSQSSYISSDNDSEIEDADIRKELQSLREKHLKEISELQSQQKQEIEALYRRLGKPLPPNLGLFHTAPPAGRRRRTSRNKLKAGKLLNPLVQQLKAVASSTGHLSDCSRGPPAKDLAKASVGPAAAVPAAVPASDPCGKAVQTRQPCSVRASLSSDICSGLASDGGGAHGQGSALKRLCLGKDHSSRSSTSSLVPGPEPGPQPALHVQAQVNNSNNKKGTFTDDLHKLVDEWTSRTAGATQMKPSLNQLKQTQKLHNMEAPAGQPPVPGEARAVNAPRAAVGMPCLALAPGLPPTSVILGATPALPVPMPVPVPGTALSSPQAPPCALPLGQSGNLLPAAVSWGPWATQADSWCPSQGPGLGTVGVPVLPVLLLPPAVSSPGPRLRIM
ncbi:Serine/threonine-protein kinase WNK2 [Galemys pyrenaicus]|uniref:Serine/threonine-protein kinase WNK2 n=1 Tax=Galemys pyrenaicus TaxID=202257 RepID=A0A8J6DX56_GALPY|nr:Serine/threonine-protein kinase WNK2 [Galemys pyrenaicus]